MSHCRLKLIPLILQTDSSRIVTLVIHDHLVVPKINGVTAEHHNLSHHGRDPEKIKQRKIIETAILGSFAEFLTRMAKLSQSERRLLDKTSVLFGSNLGNANSHDPRNLPIVVAGGGYEYESYVTHDAGSNTPLCNLFVNLLNNTGIDLERFGTISGTLDFGSTQILARRACECRDEVSASTRLRFVLVGKKLHQ